MINVPVKIVNILVRKTENIDYNPKNQYYFWIIVYKISIFTVSLEKCFVVFRLGGLNRNLRNELKKSKKIYFYDTGVLNAVIQQFAPVALRGDMGALWENFFIVERMKRNHYGQHFCNTYFWRTNQQQEIDLVEETDGQMTAFEMKWNPSKKAHFPKAFLEAYPVKETVVVTPENYLEYLV